MWLRQTQSSVLRQNPLGDLTPRSEFPGGAGGGHIGALSAGVQGTAGTAPDVILPPTLSSSSPLSPAQSIRFLGIPSGPVRPGPALSSPQRQLGRAGVMSCF